MRTGAIVGALLLAALGAGTWAVISARNQPPTVTFVKVKRETITDVVPTNGKVEPIDWAEARAERAGPVESILVQRGQHVDKDAALVQLDSSEAKADLVAAQTRVAQARNDLDVLDRGGRAGDLTAIASDVDRARLDLASAQKDYDALSRLASKQAATAFEVSQAKDRVVRAPIAGTVYQFDLRPGAYLNAGAQIELINGSGDGRANHAFPDAFLRQSDGPFGVMQAGFCRCLILRSYECRAALLQRPNLRLRAIHAILRL